MICAAACGLVISACRAEDTTPHYNYIGGTPAGETQPTETTQPETVSPSAETPDLTTTEGSRELATTTVELGSCNLFSLPLGKGFIDTHADFNIAWASWCPTQNLPDIDFATKFVAYYFENVGGCTDLEFKGARVDNGAISVEVKRSAVSSPCACPLMLKAKRFVYAVERTPGTPSFTQTTVEKPCPD